MDIDSREVQGSSKTRVNDQNLSSWIRVCSLQPLIFQCTGCGQRFYAFAPKMIDDLPGEIEQHVRKRHGLRLVNA